MFPIKMPYTPAEQTNCSCDKGLLNLIQKMGHMTPLWFYMQHYQMEQLRQSIDISKKELGVNGSKLIKMSIMSSYDGFSFKRKVEGVICQ